MMPSTLRTFRLPQWHVVAATDPGRARSRQEDAWAVLPAARFAGQTVDVFAVFDGLGGEPNGEAAAKAAQTQLESCLLHARHVDEVLPALDRHVARTKGMTTAVVVVVARQRRGLAWVLTAGDSAAYVSAGGNLVLVMKKDRSGGAITSCLGADFLIAHSTPVQYQPGHTLLLCTDGVDDVIGLSPLRRLAECTAAESEDVLRSIYAEIGDKGAPDNATLIVARALEG